MLNASTQLEKHSLHRVNSGTLGVGKVGLPNYFHPLIQVSSDQRLKEVGGLHQGEKRYRWIGWGDTGVCKASPPLLSPVLGPKT